jgi:hypothetical protein
MWFFEVFRVGEEVLEYSLPYSIVEMGALGAINDDSRLTVTARSSKEGLCYCTHFSRTLAKWVIVVPPYPFWMDRQYRDMYCTVNGQTKRQLQSFIAIIVTTVQWRSECVRILRRFGSKKMGARTHREERESLITNGRRGRREGKVLRYSEI